MSFKLALVQPKTYFGKEDNVDEKNLKSALNYIDEASENKADIICLPETYPGPWRKPVDWTPIPALQKKAKEKSDREKTKSLNNFDIEKQYFW